MSPDEADRYLDQLRAKIDQHFADAVEREPESFACASGCSRCCGHRFGVFALEARRVREALLHLEATRPGERERLRASASDPEHAHQCALLLDDRCAVYEERPLLCRTHGLPTPSEGGGFDACPLNFTLAPPHPKSLLHPMRLTEGLAMVAALSGADERILLTELALETDTDTR